MTKMREKTLIYTQFDKKVFNKKTPKSLQTIGADLAHRENKK